MRIYIVSPIDVHKLDKNFMCYTSEVVYVSYDSGCFVVSTNTCKCFPTMMRTRNINIHKTRCHLTTKKLRFSLFFETITNIFRKSLTEREGVNLYRIEFILHFRRSMNQLLFCRSFVLCLSQCDFKRARMYKSDHSKNVG